MITYIAGKHDPAEEQRTCVHCTKCGVPIEYSGGGGSSSLKAALRLHNCLEIPFQELKARFEALEDRFSLFDQRVAQIELTKDENAPWIMKTRNP